MPNSGREFQIKVVAEPLPGDAPVENGEARIYFADIACAVLDNTMPDVEFSREILTPTMIVKLLIASCVSSPIVCRAGTFECSTSTS